MIYHRIDHKSNTTGNKSGYGNRLPFRSTRGHPRCSGVRVHQSMVFCDLLFVVGVISATVYKLMTNVVT